MKYLSLIWASLFRSKTRTLLTLLSVVAAFLLFGMLDAVRVAFTSGSESLAGNVSNFRIPACAGMSGVYDAARSRASIWSCSSMFEASTLPVCMESPPSISLTLPPASVTSSRPPAMSQGLRSRSQ